MYHLFAAVLAAGACASSLQAQTSPPVAAEPLLTLAQALERAGAAAPALDAAEAGLRAAEAQRRVAGLRPNPSIMAQTENVAGSGVYQGMRSSENTATFTLPLELGGKRLSRIAVADAQMGRAALEAAIAEADVRLRVTQAYTAALATQRRETIAREQAGIAAEALRAAQVRIRAGRASPLEEQRAQVTRIGAEGAAEQAGRNAGVARADLARLTGGSAGRLDEIWFDRVGTAGPQQTPDAAGTLAAAAARAELAMASAQERLARSQRVPDVTFSAGARRLEQTNDTAAVFGLSVPLPLFNTGRAGLDVAAAQRRQADAQRRLVLIDAAQAIAAAWAEAANAAANARNASGPALAAAQEAARIARIGYREGKFGQLDLIDAERMLANIRTAAIDALAAYHDAEARLERLTTPEPMKDRP